MIEQFWQDYEAEFPKDSNAKAKNELELAKKMLKMTGKPYFFTGGMFDGEKLIALSRGVSAATAHVPLCPGREMGARCRGLSRPT